MFRPFRKHGPSPFEVMSSTWRDSQRGDKQADAPQDPGPGNGKASAAGATAIAPAPAATASAAPAPAKAEVKPTLSTAPPIGNDPPRLFTPTPAPADAPSMARPPAKAPPARPAVAHPKPAPEAAPATPSTLAPAARTAPAKPAVAPAPTTPRKPAGPRRTMAQRFNAAVAWIARVSATRWAIARTWSIRAWTKFQSRSRITRTHAGIAAGLFGLVIVLYLVGNSGKATAPMLVQPGDVQDNNLAAIEPAPGTTGATAGPGTRQPGALTPTHAGNSAGPRLIPDPRVADANRPDPGSAVQPRPKMARGKTDSREKGLRYYILATYSVNKEEYMTPLLEYLWSQGVEAGAFNAHNSGYFQVIALQGFSKDEINAGGHKKYEDTLRRIGRLWKAEGGGDDNLSGMYIAEHKGVALNTSITKAN